MTAKKITVIDDAKPFFYMMQRSFPFNNFIGFYADLYNRKSKDFRPEWYKLLDKCKEGQVDVIIMPSIHTLSDSITDIIEQARKLKFLPKPVYLYFMAEKLYSGDDTFETYCGILGTFYQELSEINKKKRQMYAYIKEGLSRIANGSRIENEGVD